MLHKTTRPHLLTAILLATPALCWATGCGSGDVDASSDFMTDEPETTLYIDEADEGQTFDVTEGELVVVRLPGNITTGYEWTVAATDKTFGYPIEETYLPDQGTEQQAGSGGVFEKVWETKGFLPMAGPHRVELEYRRSWETEGIDTFTFTVNIQPPME
ncbi:MAG: protease inhibitor I42 family protein [Deltaproteobacteria bacterium]|nr:protease inhibitor I42 family protein [Deltaproteobacteria bacterium]